MTAHPLGTHAVEPSPGGPPTFGILGELTVSPGSGAVRISSFQQRLILGSLLCHANATVPVDALTDALWDDDPPRSAHKIIQVLVWSLRTSLGLGGQRPEQAAVRTGGRCRISYSRPGYRLDVDADQLDASRFEAMARQGRLAGSREPAEGADRLREALDMWRGPVLPTLSAAPTIAPEAARLDELYTETYESWAEAALALGDHLAVMEGITPLVGRYPLRERLRRVQMIALYRCGRQTEALAAYDGMRRLLASELGLEPSPVLVRIHRAILVGVPPTGEGERSPRVQGAVRSPRVQGAVPAPAEPAASTLPRDVPGLVGRRGEVDRLDALLDRRGPGRTVVVSGPPGAGKTALAVHCAHRLGARFPGGRFFARLRGPEGQPRPAGAVLADVLRSLRPDEPQPAGESDRADRLRTLTSGRGMLFVLDDAGTEAQVRAILPALGDGSVIVTMQRHPAGIDGVARMSLPALDIPQAVELLGRLIGTDRIAAEPAEAERLVGLVGGLPLAIRIAGVKLAGLPHLSLRRYGERLADDGRLLDELVAGDLRLRDRLARSVDHLDPHDRSVLRRLSALHEETFTAGRAAGRLGTTTARAEAAIERLVEEHLVEARTEGEPPVVAHGAPPAEPCTGEPRYRLLGVVRAFARGEVACA